MKAIYFTPAITWLVISVILLTIPGNEFPQSSLFDLPYFDKYIHFGMFFLLTVLFSFPFFKLSAKPSAMMGVFYKIAFYVVLYGIIMEFVQKFFTIRRTFDITDILFDSLGSFSALFAVRQYAIKKNRPQ